MEGRKKVTGGRLKLKGITISKRSKKKAKSVESEKEATSLFEGIKDGDREVEAPEAGAGSGRIVTSGVTVQGFETKFRDEIDLGDTIIVFHPTLLREEERAVIGILSQRSLTLHEKFSNDILSTTPYRIRKDSVLLQHKAERSLDQNAGDRQCGSSSSTEEGYSKEQLQDEVSRQLEKKLKRAKQTLTYREKTGMWGYRVVTEEIDKKATAEQLLDMRVKRMGRDKFCW